VQVVVLETSGGPCHREAISAPPGQGVPDKADKGGTGAQTAQEDICPRLTVLARQPTISWVKEQPGHYQEDLGVKKDLAD